MQDFFHQQYHRSNNFVQLEDLGIEIQRISFFRCAGRRALIPEKSHSTHHSLSEDDLWLLHLNSNAIFFTSAFTKSYIDSFTLAIFWPWPSNKWDDILVDVSVIDHLQLLACLCNLHGSLSCGSMWIMSTTLWEKRWVRGTRRQDRLLLSFFLLGKVFCELLHHVSHDICTYDTPTWNQVNLKSSNFPRKLRVGGWTNPFETYFFISQIGSFPQIGMNMKIFKTITQINYIHQIHSNSTCSKSESFSTPAFHS